MLKTRQGHILSRLFLVISGVFAAAIGIEGFLLPSGFVDGGVTGISMAISKITEIPLYLLIPLVNLPFLLVAAKEFGEKFALRGFATVGLLALVIFLFDFPHITSDKLLTAVFGGVFLGAGIGLTIRGGSILDGTEALALAISKNSIFTVGDIIIMINVLVFTMVGFVFGVEPALYSGLTYVSASKTVDFIIHGVEEYFALLIMSQKFDSLRNTLINDLKLSVTRFKGKGGLSDEEQDILFCVITRLEVTRVKAFIQEHDKDAFIVVQHISDLEGGVRRLRAIERLTA